MLKFICDLSSPDITAHRLYQAGIQRNGGNLTVDLHRVHCLLQDRFSSVVRHGHRAVNHDGRPLSTGTGSDSTLPTNFSNIWVKSSSTWPRAWRITASSSAWRRGLTYLRSSGAFRRLASLAHCSTWESASACNAAVGSGRFCSH